MTNITVAAIQMTSGSDVKANMDMVCSLIEQAAVHKPQYVQTPEMTTFLDQGKQAYLSIAKLEKDDENLKIFSKCAKAHGIYLHIGSMAILFENGKIANRSFVFTPEGEICARYDKIHMFDVDLGNGETYLESATYEAGHEAVLVNLPEAKIGLSICYDLRFAHLFRTLAQAGANILAIPAAFTKKTGQAHWHTLLKARAIETGSYVVAAAQCGKHPKERETFGHSLIIDPWGEILAQGEEKPTYIVSTLDLQKVDDIRKSVPAIHLQKSFTLKQV